MNRPTNKIRKGDTVKVLAGSEKGKTAKVSRYIKSENRVELDGLKKVKRHNKPNLINRVGSIEEKDVSYHVSNVALVSGKKASRVGFEMKKDKKVRVLRQAANKEVA